MDDDAALDALLEQLQVHGANRAGQGDAALGRVRRRRRPAGRLLLDHQPRDRRADRRALAPGREPGDGLRHRRDATTSVRTVPMHRVRAGDRVVVGFDGVRVHAPERAARRAQLRVHELRHLVGEAEGAACRAGRRPHPVGEGARRQAARGVRPRGRAHRRRARRGPARARRAGSTCCSRATASRPTTWSRTCSARRSACRSPKARRSSTATRTTCGSSTRCAGTARSRPRSRPASSPAA